MATFLTPEAFDDSNLGDAAFESRSIHNAVWVENVVGREELSGLYEYEIGLCTPMGPLSRKQVERVMHDPATLVSGPATDNEYAVHGIVKRLVMLSHGDLRDSVHYTATLVPRLWRATQHARTRLFQTVTVPAIVKTLLEELDLTEGTDFDLYFDRRHPPREYVVQYQETDFAFLSRLMEYEGIFYWFEQGPEREKLVFADANEAFTYKTGQERISYDPRGGVRTNEVVRALSQQTERRPRHYSVRDFNYRTPSVPLYGDAIIDPDGDGAWETYGEHVKNPDDCKRIAHIRAEEFRSQQEVFVGRSTVRGLRPGMRFALEGHPAQDVDQQYVVIEVEHAIDQRRTATDALQGPKAALVEAGGMTYGNAFRAVPYSVPWRPARVTPTPKIPGLMHARIDGEQHGNAAPIDEHGRYQVWLPYDMGQHTGGHAVRWTRMAQPHAGPGYGLHLPLSVGTEVLLMHIDGDPDRPIIVAAVPNPETASPVTHQNAVEGVLRTRSGIAMRFVNTTKALPSRTHGQHHAPAGVAPEAAATSTHDPHTRSSK